jgi:glycosyltransferase involved in cell wall biosynthesis
MDKVTIALQSDKRVLFNEFIMKLSIVIPMLNEQDNVNITLPAVVSKTSKLCSRFEIIAVNDGSTDETLRKVKQIQKKYPQIQIINHNGNLGYGAALKNGIKKARYDWIFFTDADMQFNVSELKKFIPYSRNYDFIIGFRKNRADPKRRKISSWLYNKAIRLLFGLKLTDVDCAFKLMRKSEVKKLAIHSNSFFVSVELMVKASSKHCRIIELPVQHLPRRNGHSTVTIKQMVKSIVDLFNLYISLR